MQPVLYRRAHERVIGGVKLDEVHPVAEAIVGLEFGPTFVGLFAEFEVFGASMRSPKSRNSASAHAAPSRATPSRSAISVA